MSGASCRQKNRALEGREKNPEPGRVSQGEASTFAVRLETETIETLFGRLRFCVVADRR